MNAEDARREIRIAIGECRNDNRVIERDDIVRWLGVADDEVMSDLDALFGHYEIRISPDAQEELHAALIPYFVKSGSAGTPQMTYFEVLDSLRATFRQLWKSPRKRPDLLQQLKAGFAELASTWPEDNSDLVVCAVLEHLFDDLSIREFFSDWKDVPELRGPYDEAVSICGG